jgi:hypothetical protein
MTSFWLRLQVGRRQSPLYHLENLVAVKNNSSIDFSGHLLPLLGSFQQFLGKRVDCP